MLKPPHGWNAVAWELAIVTLGVLLALAAQQWAESRDWRSKVEASKAALRDELGEHYGYAVEYRVVYPCLQAQIEGLRKRVLASSNRLDPAPVFHEADDEYVLRIPTKYYPTDAWQEALSDGVVQRFDAPLRRQFAGHYASLVNLARQNTANEDDERALMVLARPLPLDASIRFTIIKTLEEMSGRLRSLDVQNGQVLDYVRQIGMVPNAADAQAVTERYGTYKFCRARGLPLRSFGDAMRPVPN